MSLAGYLAKVLSSMFVAYNCLYFDYNLFCAAG